MGLDFGPWGADFSASGFEDIFLDGVAKTAPWPDDSFHNNFSGNVEFHAGPLESLTVTDVPELERTYSHYEYGPGTFTLTAHWLDERGNPTQGSFVAPLFSLSVDLCEHELSIIGCGTGGSRGDGFATFGTGQFDENLAHALRIGRSGDLSFFLFGMDMVGGVPSDNFRFGGSPSGRETFEIGVAGPEPSVLALFLLSSIAALTWAQTRRRAAR